MERWIVAGRVAINGAPAKLGDRVGATDKISVDDRPVPRSEPGQARVLVLNKLAGTVVSRGRQQPERHPRSGQGSRTPRSLAGDSNAADQPTETGTGAKQWTSVFEGLPALRTGRWISVGRLDIQTTGLLLFTNDGALAHRLMHPATGIDREYAVRVNGLLGDDAENRLRKGVTIDQTRQSFSDLRYFDGSGRNHWYHVVLMEGRNREVRELFASQGVTVTRLKRVRYGPVILPPWLPRGTWEEMSANDVADLCRAVGHAVPRTARAADSGRRRTGDNDNRRSMLIPYPTLTESER